MPTETRVSEPILRADSVAGSPAAGNAARRGEEISLLDLLIVLAERRRTILWTAAIVTITAVVVSLLLPNRYTASVTLLPPQQSSSLSSQLAAQLGSVGGMAASLAAGGGGNSLLKNPNDTYVAMLKSRTVEDAMIQHFGLMQEYHDRYLSDARRSFEHHAAVDGNTKDGLIHISVEDRDPRRAAELANGYIDQFRNLSQHLAITEAGQRRAFFEQQLKQANQNLADAEESLKNIQEKTGLISLDSQARALIESAASLRAQVTAKEVQIQGMQTFATGENAELIKAEQELEGLRAQLAKLGGNEDSPGAGLIPPRGQMTAAGMDYIRKLRDVKYYETIFDILARQFELAKLDEAKEGAIIQVVDPATVPDKRSFPKRGLIVAGAAAGGLILGMFLALMLAGYERLKEIPETASKLITLREAVSSKRHGNLHA